MTTSGDDIVERDIEEVAIAISRYESDMLGRYMWEALDEQERGYYLDMARSVFAALPSLRAALAAAGPGREETIEECAKVLEEDAASFKKNHAYHKERGNWFLADRSERDALLLSEWGKQIRALASQPAKPVPVEAVEAARRMLSKGPGENHSPLDISTVCRALLAITGKS